MELLRHVQADWSEDVEELVQTCLGMDHPSCTNLKKQYRLLQLKKLLQSYDIRDFNFAGAIQGWVRNKSEAYWTWGCLYKIKIQVKFIAHESIFNKKIYYQNATFVSKLQAIVENRS